MKKGIVLFLAMAVFLFCGSHFSAAQTEMPMAGKEGIEKGDIHSGMPGDMKMLHQSKAMSGCGCGCCMGGCRMGGGCGMMGRGTMGPGMMGRGMRGMMGGMAGHRHMKELLRHLDLNETQKSEVFGIHDKAAKDMIRKKADIQIARLELKELLQKEPLDLAAVDAKVRQIQNMKTDVFLSFLKTREQIKAVLNPEQRKRLRDFEMGGMSMMEDDRIGMSSDDEEGEAEED